MSQKIRSAVAVFVLVLLSAGAVSALPLASAPYEPSGFMAAAWDWLTSLAGRFGGLWEKERSSMDPNGLNKEGSQMDPNGQPGSPAGSQIDPNGLNKAGSSMDPDGLI